MNDIIEINYISPKSSIKFDNVINSYYLIITSSGINNQIFLHKIKLDEIDNISETIRAFAINKAILIDRLQYPEVNVRLFSLNKSSFKLSLLFTGSFNINLSESNSIQIVKLFTPSKILGNHRAIIYNDDTDLLEEQFFNYETFVNGDECIVFFTKLQGVNKSDRPIKKSLVINPLKEKERYIFNRYHQMLVKEQKLLSIKEFCESNSFEDYLKFIDIYSVDVNRYENKDKDTFKSMFMRKIKTNFRKLNYDPFVTNVLSAPIDGRYIGFDINGSTKFKINSKDYHFKDLVLKPYQLINGSGFLTRTLPNDYQRLHMPFGGYLTQIGILSNLESYIISMRFESNYFIPNDVHERDYKSVIYGHNVSLSRAWPELVDVQPDTSLIFYLIMIGDQGSLSANFTNKKLQDIKKIIKPNSVYKPVPHWFDKAEELLTYNCNLVNNTIFLINRRIDFTSDIKHNSNLPSKINTYVKLKDILGVIN